VDLNLSTAHKSNFRLVFPFLPFFSGNEKGDSVLLYLKSLSLPELSTPPVDVKTQYGITVQEPGNELNYGNLNVTFTLTERFENYKMLYTWMMKTKSPETFEIATNTKVDAFLHILTNNKNPKVKIKFINIFPIGLSEVSLDYTEESSADLDISATFAFNYFIIED